MKNILIVEDQKDVADSLALLLEASGYSVRVAYNGVEGLEEAAREPPDAVILDIGLPTIDGVEVAKTLRARYGMGVRVIACSALNDGKTRLKMLAAGFDAILVKPAPLDKMLDAIAGVGIGRRSSPRTR